MHAPLKYLPIECIFCEEVFRIAQNAEADSLVECPICHQKFKAKLALATDAPIGTTINPPLSSDASHPSSDQTSTSSDRTSTEKKHAIPPSGRLTTRGNSRGPSQSQRPSNESYRTLEIHKRPTDLADTPIEITTEPVEPSSANPTESHTPVDSDFDSGSRGGSSESRSQSDRSRSRRRSSRSSSSSSSSSSSGGSRRRSRSSRRPSSDLENASSWNEIGVDGLPVRKRTPKLTKLQEHDGEEGGLRELVMICLGGLICLPITQICLWWFVRMDPLYLGPPVSAVIPQIVPTEFQSAVVQQTPEKPSDQASQVVND